MSTSRLLSLPAIALGVCVLFAGADGVQAGSRVAVTPPAATTTNRAVQRHSRPLPLGARAARIALRAVGTPYRWGGSSLRSGFDCSGLVMWAYGRAGVRVPHHAATLATMGRRVPRGRLRPGDLLFFPGYGHVGVYVGRGRMVHAPQSGERVRLDRVGPSGRQPVEVRRLRS